jgi:acyl carrier protein
VIDRLGERVRAFVAEELSVALATILPDTRLNHDLGCDGDDAVELLEAFGSRFGVDISGMLLLVAGIGRLLI